MKLIPRLLLLFASLLGSLSALPPEQEQFWNNLRALCGQSFAGRMVEGTAASDAAFKDQAMVMQVRSCGEVEIRIPFHVGEDHSRSWVITRTATGLRLKHDHRHEDGTEDKVTQYGGDTVSAGTGQQQEFPADDFTGALLPAARNNIWTLGVQPGRLFTYGLRREAEGRRFRVEFDLTAPAPAPPKPWGGE